MGKDFKDVKDGEIIATFGDDRPILNKREKKHRCTVKPYLKFTDFNQMGADGFHCEDNPSHAGVEVGVKVTF